MGVSPMGTPPHLAGVPTFPTAPPPAQQQQQLGRPPPQGVEAGANPFMTEPSPLNAGAMPPSTEAGAGPSVTDPSQAPR